MEDFRLTQRGSKLELIKSYENAFCFRMYEPGRVHGISFQTDTTLIVLGDGRQAFYNLSNNKFSSKIRVGRVIPSHEDGKWYCFDYSRKDRKPWLRDITRDIHTKLEGSASHVNHTYHVSQILVYSLVYNARLTGLSGPAFLLAHSVPQLDLALSVFITTSIGLIRFHKRSRARKGSSSYQVIKS